MAIGLTFALTFSLQPASGHARKTTEVLLDAKSLTMQIIHNPDAIYYLFTWYKYWNEAVV